MKNKALKIVIWIVFILCCTLIGAYFSMAPYMWGERDGSGILLWFFTVIPFMIILFFALVISIFGNLEKHSVKPHVAVIVGSAVVFFLNFLFPYIYVRFDYFREIDTPVWMWILYVCLPFIYGGISFILFNLIGTPKDGNKLK